MNNKAVKFLTYAAGAFVLLCFALYNGYAIITGDSSVYLNSGINMEVPGERPVFYGLFIRFTSFMFSMWFTLFAQCLILSYLCMRFIRSVVGTIEAKHLIGLLFIVSLGTIAGWYAGQLMPDIFTPVLFLSAWLLVKDENSKWERALLFFILYLSVVVHYSHLMIATLFSGCLFLLSFLFRKYFRDFRIRSLQLFAVAILGWLSVFTSNYIAGNGFITGKATHVFLMGKLNESGVLSTYLYKACPVKHYKICDYRDDLPVVAWEFIWDRENSPVFKTGGWEANREEYNAIIKDIITRPKYWPLLAFKSLEATFRQILLLNIDEGEERPWVRFEKGDFVYASVQNAFPHEANELLYSRQNLKLLGIVFFDHLYTIVFLLSTLIVFLLDTNTRKKAIPVYIIVVLFLFLNAFVTATFANVSTRLNSRTIWLLPMTNFAVIYSYLRKKMRQT